MAQLTLTFEPAYDPYHTIFRMIRVFDVIQHSGRIEFDKWRIADFFFCFPEHVGQVRLRPNHRRFRELARRPSLSYGDRPDGRLAFNRMKPTQAAAAQTLALGGYLRSDRLELSWIERTDTPPPAELVERARIQNEREPLLVELTEALIQDYPLEGVDGLKHRTALLEHRYDAT